MSQDFFYPPGSSNTIVFPATAATAANQVTQIAEETAIAASTASIDTKTPTTGQKTMANSSPVVIASDQSPIHVIVDSATTPEHVIVDSSALPTGASTAANQATEIASLASIDGKLTSPLTVTGPLTNTQLRATPVPVSISSGITNPLPVTDAAAEASLASIDSKLTSPITVTGPLTDTQLRATPVPISGTVTANAGTNLNTSALSLQSTQLVFSNKSASAFINSPFDEAVITYVGATTNIATVVYKLATVTVNTLTLTYDGSNRLIDVVKT